MSRTTKLVGAAVILALVSCAEGPTDLPPLVVEVVEVAPAGPVLAVGDTVRLTVFPKTADGTVLGGLPVEWEAESVGVVALSGGGVNVLVEAVSEGTTRILATVSGLTGSVLVTVEAPAPAAVDSVVVSPESLELEVGEQALLDVVLLATDGAVLEGRSVAWSSAAAGIAAVDAAGQVTAVGAGTVVIAAESEGVRGEAVVVVTEPTPPPAAVAIVWLDPTPVHFWVGQSRYLEARVLDLNGIELEGRTIAWSVEDPTVATVDAAGEVRAVGPGTTRVLATSEGVTGYGHVKSYALPGEVLELAFLRAVTDTMTLIQTGVDTTWVDAEGTSHPAFMLVREGELEIDRTGETYRQVLVWDTYIAGSTSATVVATSTVVDEGTAEEYYHLFTGELLYVFTSTTTPGLTYDGRFTRAGELRSRQPVGTIADLWYYFELQ